jgi:hypothetical protein
MFFGSHRTAHRSGWGQAPLLVVISAFTLGLAALLVEVPLSASVAVVAGIAVFIATFLSTEAGLYLLIFSMLLSPEFGAGGLEGGSSQTTASRGVTLRAEDFLLVILGFAWLARTAVHKDLGLVRTTPLNRPIAYYTIACLFATSIGFLIGHVEGVTGFFFVLKYIEYFVVYFVVANHLHSRTQIQRFIVALLVTAFIVSLMAMAQIPSGQRVSAPFEGERGEPNTLGGYLLFIGSLVAGLALYLRDRRARMWLWTLLGVMVIPFFATLSRGSYLGLPFAYLTFVALRPGRRVVMVLLLVGLGAVGTAFMPSRVIERVTYTFDQGYTQQQRAQIGNIQFDTSTTERLESWGRALEDFVSSPLWGFGVTGYGFLDAQYPRILVETGLLGMAFFAVLVQGIFRQGFYLFRHTQDPLFKGLAMGLIAGLVGLLVHAIGANTFIIVRIMEPFWLTVGLVVCARKLETESAA